MKPWILYALISMVFAGFTSVIAKIGLTGISGELGLAVRTVFVFVLVSAFSLVVTPRTQWLDLSRDNLLWLGLSGITTTLSWVFYYKALKQGEVSTIALIDKGSIIVAILLSMFILKEQMSWKTAFGATLMLAGLLVIAKK